jgi:hypothetical protein
MVDYDNVLVVYYDRVLVLCEHKFFEESILKQRREIERLQELLAAREQQLNE